MVLLFLDIIKPIKRDKPRCSKSGRKWRLVSHDMYIKILLYWMLQSFTMYGVVESFPSISEKVSALWYHCVPIPIAIKRPYYILVLPAWFSLKLAFWACYLFVIRPAMHAGQASSWINNMLRKDSFGNTGTSKSKLNSYDGTCYTEKVVQIMPIYWWNELSFPPTVIAFDKLCLCVPTTIS